MAAGEFDDILDAKAERTSRRVSVPVDADDEFDDVLNARAERQHRYISTLIEAAVKDNPGAAAERDRLSRSTGLPPDVVARNQQELKRKEMVRAIDLNRMMRDSPILYRHFADPSFASMAIDDVGTLTRLGRTILSVPADITAQGLGLPELALKAGGEFLDWGAGNQPHANPLRDAGEWLGTIRQGQQALAEELRGDQSGAGFFEQGVLGGVSSFVQMLPGMLGTIATGNPAFALWAAGLQSGSTTAADAMDSGLPAWRSGLVGMTDGMIEAITEMAPAFKFVESMKVGDSFARFFGKQLMTELPGELLATLGQEYNAWAAGLRGDADLGEWVRTLPEAQAQTVIATLTMVALTSGLGRGAVRLLQDRKAAEEAPQKAERLRELFELSSASALRQRAPETFAEFVDQAAADGQQTLYLDAEALAQSVRQMPPEELERALPGAAEQLARGERWVSVPLGAAMAGVPGTALEDLIVQHSKLDPEGLTLTEASAATEQADSLIATEIDRIQQEATDQAVVIEQIDRVRGVIEEQIVASGRHSPDVAAVQAEWLARAYTVLADAEGMTPDQLWAERPLIIRAQQGMAASNGVNAGDRGTFDPNDPDVRFSFVGQRAATADAHALATAQERLDAGEDAESVRRDTGWFKGEDGKWRFEINDKDAKLIGLRDDGDGKAHRNSDLGEVLDHPALFAAYPALRNVWVQIEVDQSFLDESGAYTLARPADENTVARAAQIDVKARTESEALSVLLHEVQHDIQTIEGFAKGGSASDQSLPTFLEMGKAINEDATRRQEEVRNSPEYAEFVRNFIEGYEGPQYVDRRGRQVDAAQLAADEAAYQRFIAPIEEDRLQRIDGLGDSYGIDTRYAAYRLLAGEVEARNTQSRRGLTDEQRRTTPPSTTADAASRDVIVIFNGKVAHSAPPPVNAAQSVDNGASQGDGNAQRGRRTYDNGIPQGLPAERTADSDALERIIDAEQRRAGLPEGFQAVAVRQDQLPDALRGALAGLERATGTRVVIFRALTPEIADFNGVTIRDGVLYVSETAQSPATSTAAHEWVHNLRKTNPDLYARLENEVRRQGDAYGFAAKYGYTMGQAHEELTAAAVGDALTDPKFLERLAEHDAGLFTKMARAFLKFLKGFADGWRNQGSDAFLQDVQAFHDVLEEVLHAYERAKPKERAQAGFVKSVFARFQRVWHGTPHRGIETTGFKLNKIGSGEGAQAYGWGMYFASQREVAQRYQPRNKRAEELMMAEYSKAERAGDYESLELWEAALTHKLSDDILSEEEFGHIPITKRDAVARKVREIGKKTSAGGSLYSANIPENDELLDWDKPLSEQPLKVRQIIRQHKLPMYDERDYDAIQLADGSWSIYRIDPDTREAAQVARLDREDARNAQEALAMSGAQFDAGRFLYEKIARDKNGPRGASEYLNSIGIPGLRYLDGNSRGQGEGSHNYVIWDEALLTPENADIQALYQRGKVVRAAFNPSEFAITLGPDTNLTSLHHESAHAFLELLHYLAARDGASERSRGMMDAALKWMGIAGDTPEERLAAWGAMSLNEKRAGHEQFAEGYEAYLFEGKAPTPELQRLMGRFRAWMKQAYGSLKQFFAGKGWQLDPEIRAVYDRILATDAEIRSAEERAGLVPDDAATTAAIEKLTAQSLRDLRWAREARNKTLRALQREAASKRKAVREEVAAEVMASPLEQVRKILRTTKEEDVNTPALMDALGVSSPEELARVLTLAPSAAEMIEAGTDRRMLERYGELTDPEALAAAADAAVHNEARARALAAELRAQDEVMGERADTGRRNARGARITENVVLEAGKRFADSIVRSTPVGELKAKRQLYLAAERKAARAQRAATAAGKTADAIAAQKDQLLNHLVAKGLMDAVDEADAAREEFKEYVKAGMKAQVTKGRDPAIVSMLRVIMGQYGIIERQAEKARDYLQMVQAFDPITSQRLEAIIAQAEQNAKPYKALTVDELQALRDLLGSIWEIAKTSRMMEVDGKQMRREDAAKMLLARMEEKGIPKVIPGEYGAITPGEERVLGLKGAMAWLVRVEQWTQAMDGKWGGPFTRLIFQPIKEAADRYRADRVVYLKKYEALIKQIEPYLHADPIVAHELGGYTFSGHTALLHALLHTGNESNKRKLLLGRQWASLREDGTMDTSKWDAFLQRMHDSGVITKAHWDFVQGVWDLLEETKPLAQATHRRVFGRFFDEVAADPVTTPFGTYRGGYVPAQADARQTPDAAVRALVEDQNASMINAFPEPARGFTKGRVEYNAPLLLDLGALRQHIDKVLLFAHMEGPVTDVTKLLTDKEVSNALFRISPHAYDTILLPWLKTASRQTVETPIAGDRGVHRLVTWMRSRSGMALMFANVSNTLQQVTGFVTALNKVKASSLRRAAARYIAHPADMTEVIKAKSIFMRNRIESEVSAINASMEKILINAGVFARAEMWTQEHAYFMQIAVDNVMWPIVWSAAYDEASARGESEKDAIRWADSVIRTTQGSQLPEDVARFETGNPWARLFSQFAGYFGMLANTSASELVNIHEQGLGLVRGAGKALMIGLYGVALPVWIAEAIAIAMRGGPEDDDDDGYLDDWMAAVFGWGSIRGATAMIPYAGQAVLGIATRLNDNPVDDKLSLSPAISLIESTVGVPANVYRAIIGKGTWAAAARSAAGGATLLTGLPIYAVARPISYTLGMAEGRIEPQGPWDATRGLITGTPSPESKQRP